MHFSFGHCPELHCNIEAYVKDNKDCPSINGSLETGNGAYRWTLRQGTYIE